MKLSFEIAQKIKLDFQHLVGRDIETPEGKKVIKEIAVLPITNGDFGSFPFNYLLSNDKQNFIKPYMKNEMSLIIYLSDNSHIYFFQYLHDNNVQLDMSKYLNE